MPNRVPPKIQRSVILRDVSGNTRAVIVLKRQGDIPGGTPSAPAVANSGAGGTLTAATYSYKITRVQNGAETAASAAGTTVVAAGTTNKCTITLPGEAGIRYGIYGRVGGSELFIGYSAVAAASFDDTGAVTPAGALPTADNRIGVYDPHIPGGPRGTFDAGGPIKPATAAHGQTNVYFNR